MILHAVGHCYMVKSVYTWQLFIYFLVQIKLKEVDEYGSGKRLPQCQFSAHWIGGDLTPKIHNEKISLRGTKTPQSVTVTCVPGLHYTFTYSNFIYTRIHQNRSYFAKCTLPKICRKGSEFYKTFTDLVA